MKLMHEGSVVLCGSSSLACPLQTSGGRRETTPIHLMFHLKMVHQRFLMVSLAYRPWS
ncbi:hypothetical protein ARSEF4850_003641 [Beauveria asiatica]